MVDDRGTQRSLNDAVTVKYMPAESLLKRQLDEFSSTFTKSTATAICSHPSANQ